MSDELIPLKPNEFPQVTLPHAPSSLFQGAKFTLKNTNFYIIARKSGGKGIQRIHKAIKLAWPKWISYFPFRSDPITILETDWGLGGGSLGSFALAVHLKGDYDAESAYMEFWSSQMIPTCGLV